MTHMSQLSTMRAKTYCTFTVSYSDKLLLHMGSGSLASRCCARDKIRTGTSVMMDYLTPRD